MRETLGLSGRGRPQMRAQPTPAAKQRHRFVQDGEIPVTHISLPRDGESSGTSRSRIAALEAALEAEHGARTRVEQAVQAGLAHIHALETKLAHVEMAHREALQAERTAREQAEADLASALAAREAASPDAATQRRQPDASPIPARPQAKPRPQPVPRAAKPKAAPRVKEPKPVKWWLGKSALR